MRRDCLTGRARRLTRTGSLCGLCGLLGVVACGQDAESARGSPTGTTLVPRTGLGAAGYEVIDEVCGSPSDPGYLARFETPMFRSVRVVDEVAYLVDGSLLWAVNIANPTAPERLSLTRLPGHALSIAAGDGNTLWVAAGEAGLLGVDVSDPAAPVLSLEASFGERTLDVEWRDGRGYVALGAEGIKTFVLDAQGSPTLEHELASDGFTVELDVTSSRLVAAACDRVLDFELVSGEPPRARLSREVPSGSGRAVTATERAVYVAGGDALYAYGIDEVALRPLGRYADPDVPGFYVNDIVVSGDTGFIAAGDESVRVVDLGAIGSWSAGAPGEPEPEPELDDAFELTMPTVRIEYGDPVSVGLHGDALLVLGNFRWVGERLLRILDASRPAELPELGRYAQPDRYSSLERGPLELWLQEQGGDTLELDAELRVVQDWGFSDDGQARRFGDALAYVTSEGWLYCAEGFEGRLLHGAAGGGWAASADRLVVGIPGDNALVSYSLASGCPEQGTPFAEDLGLVGFARLGTSGGRLLAYDRVLGTLHVFDDASGRPPAEPRSYDVGLCENYDWADGFSGASEVRARFAETPDGFTLLCPSDEDEASSLRVFRWDASGEPVERVPLGLPLNLYTDVVPAGDGWALTAFDNGRYESELILLDAMGQITARLSYDGRAMGVAELPSGLYVFDDDRGVLRYDDATASLVPVELVRGTEGATP